jgi:hypothetical protein
LIPDNTQISFRVCRAGQGKFNGDLHYDDYASRASASPLTLTADDILARGLRTAAQWGEIVNDVNVTYRAGTEVARDENSIIQYGQLSGTRTTQLHNAADALTQANDFLESRASLVASVTVGECKGIVIVSGYILGYALDSKKSLP